MKKGFSFIEVLIVVAILGILAALTLPAMQGHTARARSAAAKDNLRVLRDVIQVYTIQHDGKAPGYMGTSLVPGPFVRNQLLAYTSDIGTVSTTRSAAYPHGPYLKKIPENPYNNRDTIQVIADGQSFPPVATGTYGWLYKPSTQQIRLDWPGTDLDGVRYYDY